PHFSYYSVRERLFIGHLGRPARQRKSKRQKQKKCRKGGGEKYSVKCSCIHHLLTISSNSFTNIDCAWGVVGVPAHTFLTTPFSNNIFSGVTFTSSACCKSMSLSTN